MTCETKVQMFVVVPILLAIGSCCYLSNDRQLKKLNDRPPAIRTVIAEDEFSVTYRITDYEWTGIERDWYPREKIVTVEKRRP